MNHPMGQHRLGIIADTHGLLRPEAVETLRGVERILHAGDVGKPEILKRLSEVAPVTAVRGNVDTGRWARELPHTQVIEVGSVTLYMIHILQELDLNPAAAGFQAVISGHSHQPSVQWKEGVLYLNPGSAGPRRFKLPVSVAILVIDGETLEPKLMELSRYR